MEICEEMKTWLHHKQKYMISKRLSEDLSEVSTDPLLSEDLLQCCISL